MELFKKALHQVHNDSLYRNSIYLMLSTAVMSFFGFFFWIINARLFTSEEVGIATTLISVMTLITNFSLLGLGNSLIKYLPSSDSKNDKINTAFMLVGITSIVISLIYLVFIGSFSPKLLFVLENPVLSLLFVIIILVSALNQILENVFIAYRSSKYVLIKNTVLSVVKLVIPFILIGLGAYGIFMSFGISIIIAALIGLGFLFIKFNYTIQPLIRMSIVKRMVKFSLGTYAAGFIGGLPALVLPVVITNSMGAKYSAYFYVDMMIANLLYIIPLATSQSLFAEGSYSAYELRKHVRKAIKIISLILIPAILITLIFGKYILLAFGKQYSSDGFLLLQILSISAVFLTINFISNAILYVKHKIGLVILVNLLGAIAILSLSVILARQDLIGIGAAWIVGQGIISIIYLFLTSKML